MKRLHAICTVAFLGTASAALLLLPQFAFSGPQQMSGMQHSASAAEPVPAYHAEAPKGDLPPTMEASIFMDNKMTFNAYVVASRIRKVLYQEPCYCHCDRSVGHGSLLDCFVSRHGSGCDTCMKEAFYSYEQTRRGRTPAQIREGIMRGDWQKVHTEKYQAAYLPPAAK